MFECSLHHFSFNGMQSILRYAWDSCRFLWMLQVIAKIFAAAVKHFFFSQRFDKTVQPVDFSLRGEEMGRSLETEIKVAKLLQKQPWVPLDDFFYRT